MREEINTAVGSVGAEYRELNDELVMPAYRRFCDESRLPFHFWDRLPNSDFDPEIARREGPLHEEAMNLFNRLSPAPVLFKDRVVAFQFTDWGGGFTYTKVPIAEFVERASNEVFYFEQLQQRHKVVTRALAILVGFEAAAVVAWLTHQWLAGVGGVVTVAVLLTVSVFLERRLGAIPRRALPDDGRLTDVNERLQSLRTQLEAIRDRPDRDRSWEVQRTPL